MARTFEHTVEYAQPVATVWKALTEPDQMGLWLMNFDNDVGEITAQFQAKAGTTYRLQSNKKARGWRGYVVGDVVQVTKPRLLVITWAHSKAQDKAPIRIDFHLEATETGTRLRMVQTGYKAGLGGWFAMKMGAMGWRQMLGESIKPVLDGKAA